jgi:hypothetical protein
MLKVTNLDTDILLALIANSDKGGWSTTDLAKALFNCSTDYELRKRDNSIRYRVERMRKKDLLKKNGVRYTVNEGRVFLTRACMHLEEISVDVSMGQMLVVYPRGGEVMMRQITFLNSKNSK